MPLTDVLLLLNQNAPHWCTLPPRDSHPRSTSVCPVFGQGRQGQGHQTTVPSLLLTAAWSPQVFHSWHLQVHTEQLTTLAKNSNWLILNLMLQERLNQCSGHFCKLLYTEVHAKLTEIVLVLGHILPKHPNHESDEQDSFMLNLL